MPTWFLLAIGAQFIYAVVAIFDKYIVTSKTVLHPFSYTFYVAVLSSLSVFIFFFSWLPLPGGIQLPSFSNLIWPSFTVATLSLVTGMAMFIALVNMFEALSKTDASDAVPVITSVGAMATLVFEFLFLEVHFVTQNLIGFGLLALGTILVSHLRFSKVLIFHTLVSGTFFAIYYILIKIVFNLSNFDSGFLYTRIGIVIAALLVITLPSYRKRIFRKLKNRTVKKSKASAYVLTTKTIAGVASIMTLKAVELGSVAIVQAIAGVQFLFLILFSAIFGKVTNIHFGENVNAADVIQKGIAATVITIGLFFVFI